MDEKYYYQKLRDIEDQAETQNRVYLGDGVFPILKQIAHDAKMEQARVDREAVEKLERQATMYIPWRSETVECLAVVKTALTAVALEDK